MNLGRYIVNPYGIAIAIPKSSVGKTTTTLNIGVALAGMARCVLLLEADLQGCH